MINRKLAAAILCLALAMALSAPCAVASAPEASGYFAPETEPVFLSESSGLRLFGSEALPEVYGFTDDAGVITPIGQSPVKNQGSNGTCWAFSAVAAVEAALLRDGYDGVPDLSETHMIYSVSQYGASISDLSNTAEGYATTIAQGGNSDYAASYLMRGTTLGGIVNEQDDPYLWQSSTMPYRSIDITKSVGEKKAYTVENIKILTGSKTGVYSPEDEGAVEEMERIKRAIMDCGAVSSSIFWSSTDNYYRADTGAYYVRARNAANHAVAIVGWDDNYSRYNFKDYPAGDGAWLVKNSYGTGRGIDGSGYYWVSYYDGRIGEWSYAVDGVEPYKAQSVVHEYDYRVDNVIGGAKSYAVAFEREREAEKLSALRIALNSPAEIEIYLCADYGGDMESAEFRYVGSASFDLPGFYTVELQSDEVIMGEAFALRVDVISDSAELLTYSAKKAPTVEIGGTERSAFYYKTSGSWTAFKVKNSVCNIPGIKAVCEDISDNSYAGIAAAEMTEDGLRVTVETDMAAPAILMAASYENGRLLSLSMESVFLKAKEESLTLAVPTGEYTLFLLDTRSFCPIAEKKRCALPRE